MSASSHIMSVDIGLKNMAFARLVLEPASITQIDFQLYDLSDYGPTKKSIGVVIQRCSAVVEIFDQEVAQFKPDYIVIEKQVVSNENAMCIMYALITKGIQLLGPQNVFLFDPKTKFTALGINYDTKNKKHKKLSVELCQNMLQKVGFTELLAKFDSNDKKDDIADSINQGLVWAYKNKRLCKDVVNNLYT